MNVYHCNYNFSHMGSKFSVTVCSEAKTDRELVELQGEIDEFINILGYI